MDLSDIEQLVDLYGKDVYRFCCKLAKSKYDADDLYQDTFLTALQLAKKIDKNNNPKGFLFSLSANIWRNEMKKKARHERIAPKIPITKFNVGKISNDFDVSNSVMNRELFTVTNEIVSNLDDKYRIPIILYYNCELSIGDISKICKCPNGTIKSRLSKGRQLVKYKLEVLGFE